MVQFPSRKQQSGPCLLYRLQGADWPLVDMAFPQPLSLSCTPMQGSIQASRCLSPSLIFRRFYDCLMDGTVGPQQGKFPPTEFDNPGKYPHTSR